MFPKYVMSLGRKSIDIPQSQQSKKCFLLVVVRQVREQNLLTVKDKQKKIVYTISSDVIFNN